VLCGARGLDELELGARVGTSSIRRMAQLRAAREDLDVVALRGNVDTRLAKLADGGERLRAIVLAGAGLQRLGRAAEIGGVLDRERFVPAPGQGTVYYRLVLYENNGDSLISPVSSVSFESAPTTIQVYPNPTNGDITIKTPTSCREIQIFDVLGRKLVEKTSQGLSQSLSLAVFPDGVYFLKLFTDSGNKLIKLEKR